MTRTGPPRHLMRAIYMSHDVRASRDAGACVRAPVGARGVGSCTRHTDQAVRSPVHKGQTPRLITVSGKGLTAGPRVL